MSTVATNAPTDGELGMPVRNLSDLYPVVARPEDECRWQYWRNRMLISDTSSEVATKYESPYSTDPAPQFDAPVSPLKRRASSVDLLESDEKRQRIETNHLGGEKTEEKIEEYDFDAIIAAAAADAARDVEQQSQNLIQEQNHDNHGLDNIFQQHTDHQPIQQISQDWSQHVVPQSQLQEAPVAESTPGFSSDPHLYMRILSLPILESLVREWQSCIPQALSNRFFLVEHADFKHLGARSIC